MTGGRRTGRGFLRSLISRHGKLIALIAGFLFSTMGALWALLVIDRLDSEIRTLNDQRAVNGVQIDTLNRTAGEYFIANQQGDLIFVLAQQPGANRELTGPVYQGNMLDRSTPVFTMIGELGLEKQLDYQTVHDTYVAMNDEARANLTLANFMKLKQFEQQIISQGQARVPELLKANTELDRRLNDTKARQNRNHVLGVLTAIMGSAVLLLANVIAERKVAGEVAAEEPPAPRG